MSATPPLPMTSTPKASAQLSHQQINASPIVPAAPLQSMLSADIDNKIQVELDDNELWDRFDHLTNEMIVTKMGRRLFPKLRVKVKGLQSTASYAIQVVFRPPHGEDARYKFQNGAWVEAGRAEPAAAGGTRRYYTHPDSPQPGHLWMRQSVSFERIKVTNNPMNDKHHILLNSMHKYQPYIHIYRLHPAYPSMTQLVAEATFPQTAFIAVTAYQNEQVIKLKVANNPFAKGFRNDNKYPDGRKREPLDDSHDVKSMKLATTVPTHVTAMSTAPKPTTLDILPQLPMSQLYASQLAMALAFRPQTTATATLQSPQRSSPSASSSGCSSAHGDHERTLSASGEKRTRATETQTTPPHSVSTASTGNSSAATRPIWNPFLTPPANSHQEESEVKNDAEGTSKCGGGVVQSSVMCTQPAFMQLLYQQMLAASRLSNPILQAMQSAQQHSSP